MHCVHCALPIILITIIGDELKLSVYRVKAEVGNTTKISVGGRACSLVLALVTTPHFIEITREKWVSQGGGCLLYVCISCKSSPLKSI